MIEVIELVKKFGDFTAVDNISFKVNKARFWPAGENGAGKTTTLRMLATMLRPTSGRAALKGYDTQKEPER